MHLLLQSKPHSVSVFTEGVAGGHIFVITRYGWQEWTVKAASVH